MTRQTGSFTATGDDGRQYTVLVFTEFLPAPSRANPNAMDEGMKTLKTSDGMSVNWKGKGVYEVVQTGLTIRSASPDAP